MLIASSMTPTASEFWVLGFDFREGEGFDFRGRRGLHERIWAVGCFRFFFLFFVLSLVMVFFFFEAENRAKEKAEKRKVRWEEGPVFVRGKEKVVG